MFLRTREINHVSEEVPRTVKMFKNKFFGPNGYIVAYSVGDSAAEVTLVRNDLRLALGIEGTPVNLSVTWTDRTMREYVAIRFDMELQGILNHSEPIVLKDCFAIDEFNLPARTLDMSKMRSLFPYLKDVNFDSYFDEEPVILIGSPHAYAIESIKGMIEGGPGNPVALETKLGITVYGGLWFMGPTDFRPIFGRFSADIRPIFGRYSADFRLIFGRYSADFRPIFGSFSADIRPIFLLICFKKY